MPSLPIDDVLADVASALRSARRVVVEAPPGAGKTTRVPSFLLEDGLADGGDVVVVEPRRLAARLAARHVADERGEAVGDRIGYQVRFESATGPNTRVRYVTEGVFMRQLIADPQLRGVGTVVLDEFHERRLQVDLALSWIRALQTTSRPDLGIAVMSATLDAGPIGSFLEPCPVVRAQGRRYEVDVSFTNRTDDRPLSLRVASAVRSLGKGLDGDVLVFLPGASEIRKAQEGCAAVAADLGLELVTLHGNLPPGEQDRALAPRARHKIILSTNVAESSVTIDGVVAVVDSGLARVASHAPWSGLPMLRVGPVSKASVIQRTGRAGRTRPGRCIRLFSEPDFMRRPDYELAEVQRTDLAEAALVLEALGAGEAQAFAWFEEPPASSWQAARTLLRDLDAMHDSGGLTQVGRELLRFPVHPRVGRILLEAERRGVVRPAATLAALIAERDLSLAKRSGTGDLDRRQDGPSTTDLLDALDVFDQAARARFAPGILRAAGIDVRAAKQVDRGRKQLLSSCRKASREPANVEEQLRICVLTGYPDRVAKHIRDREVSLAAGGSAVVAAGDQERLPELMVAVDAEQRQQGRHRRLVVRSTCRIEPEWLLDLFEDRIHDSEEHRFDRDRGCVESVERLMYRNLVLDETRRATVSAAASELLANEALARGVHAFAPKDALESLIGRVAFVREAVPEAGLEPLDMPKVERTLRSLCEGLRCLDALRDAGLIHALRASMPQGNQRALDRLAPEHVQLPGGRRLALHYEPGKPPWGSSRLQDFFGMEDGPRVADGRVAVVLHLLAPNRRAVQVTSDLARFWDKHYPSLRRQLCRRYPKHAWPEDGRRARPPAPGRLK